MNSMIQEMVWDPQTVDVVMKKKVINKINQLIHKDPYRECGGIFVGNFSRDQKTQKYTVFVEDLCYEELYGTAGGFEFDINYKSRVGTYIRKNYRGDYHWIGDIHSHAQYDAFFSAQDELTQLSEGWVDYLYMVVSPRTGRWEMRFKDRDHKFHECTVRIADNELHENSFRKSIERKDDVIVLNGKRCERVTFRTSRFYSEAQQKEFDKRFLHSITELDGKSVLIVGGGTIGNSLAEDAMNSGISKLSIVDKDCYQNENLPRCSMVGEDALGKPKALALSKAVAEKSAFPIEVTGINADIYDLGWGFLKDFDVVLSPVDSDAVRQYIDRGCKLYKVRHITCGTGITDDFTGNIIDFPKNAVVDLEYVWGVGYRKRLEERRSCSDIAEETQPQVMSFSSIIAGLTMERALKYLLGKLDDDSAVIKHIVNAVGHGLERDKVALRTFRYGRLPGKEESELFSVFDPMKEIPRITFDRNKPKHQLWEQFHQMFGEDIPSYRMNLEWSMNVPVAYRSIGACAVLEVAVNSGVDATLKALPPRHIYLVEGDENDYLVEIVFEDN